MSELGYTHHHWRGEFAPDGWLQSVIWRELLVPHDQPAPEHTIPPEVGDELTRHPVFPLARRADGSIAMPRDDRLIWRIARASGLSGQDAAGYCRQADELRALVADDLDAGIAVHDPAPRADSGFTHEFVDVPGLRIVPMTWRHLDAAVVRAVESGIYPAICPQDPPCCNPPEAHAWMQLAARLDTGENWQLALEFEGRALQLELITFEQRGVPTVRFTTHLTRERPHWFWREAEAPVFANLRARGFRYAHSLTRIDRPDWIQALKDNYSAVEVARYERSVALEFATDAPIFNGWPARRNSGWQWSRGNVTVREATEDDLPGLSQALAGRWNVRGRSALAQRMLREWWHLDRASVLVAIEAGEIVHARCVRQRRGNMSSLSQLSPLDAGSGRAKLLMALAVNEWQLQAGYEETSMFLPESIYAHPLVRAAYQDTPGIVETRREQFREPFMELRWNLVRARDHLVERARNAP